MYLQTNKLIREHLDFVDVVQQVVVVLHFTRKNLVVNDKGVRQSLRLMNNTKGLSCLRESFATLDVRKLVVREVEADDGHDILDVFLVLQHFGIRIGWWRLFKSVHNIPKIHGCQQHFDFELQEVELLPIEFVNNSTGHALK